MVLSEAYDVIRPVPITIEIPIRTQESYVVQSTVENLAPTRVKLEVEVPFDELKPRIDATYKSLANQIQVPGFRKGKVPARLIDQRVGRGFVIENAVNDNLDTFFQEALRQRFATLAEVDRAAETNDHVTLGLTATIDDEEVDSAEGLSYEVGSGTLLDGMDEAIEGLSAGEDAIFETTLAGGEHSGEEAT